MPAAARMAATDGLRDLVALAGLNSSPDPVAEEGLAGAEIKSSLARRSTIGDGCCDARSCTGEEEGNVGTELDLLRKVV